MNKTILPHQHLALAALQLHKTGSTDEAAAIWRLAVRLLLERASR